MLILRQMGGGGGALGKDVVCFIEPFQRLNRRIWIHLLLFFGFVFSTAALLLLYSCAEVVSLQKSSLLMIDNPFLLSYSFQTK